MASVDCVSASGILHVVQVLELLLVEIQELVGAHPPDFLIAVLPFILQSLIQVPEVDLALIGGSDDRLRESLVEYSEVLDVTPATLVHVLPVDIPAALPLDGVGAEVGIAEVLQGSVGALAIRTGRIVILRLSGLNHIFAPAWVRDGRLPSLRVLARRLVCLTRVRLRVVRAGNLGELPCRLIANEHILVLHHDACTCSQLVAGVGALARRSIEIGVVLHVAEIHGVGGALVLLLQLSRIGVGDRLASLPSSLVSATTLLIPFIRPVGGCHLSCLVTEISGVLGEALPGRSVSTSTSDSLLHVHMVLLLGRRRGVVGVHFDYFDFDFIS